MSGQRGVVGSVESEYRRYKSIGERTIEQLDGEQLNALLSPESLSVSMIVWHLAGNLRSRFADFLTSDGEKPWRDRDSEFESRQVSRDALMEKWDTGWSTLFGALESLTDDDLMRTITIRGVPLTVYAALHRSLAHAAYHVGQIAYIGKTLKGEQWTYLSIAPGGSAAYNENPVREKGPGPAR